MNQVTVKIPHSSPIIKIRCCDNKLLEYICYNMYPHVCFEDMHDETLCLFIDISLCDSGYTIKCNNQCFFACDQGVVLRSLNRILNDAIVADYPYLTIHCAVLSKDTTNYLFVGPTGTGKSTLSAYLSQKGYTYYSDDKALVDCETQKVIPFFKPIHLRKGGKLILENKYGINIGEERFNYGGEERYQLHWQSNDFPKERELRIIFINRENQKDAAIKQLSVEESLRSLVYNLVYIGKLDQRIKLALRLVSKTKCYSLCYHELWELDELLE